MNSDRGIKSTTYVFTTLSFTYLQYDVQMNTDVAQLFIKDTYDATVIKQQLHFVIASINFIITESVLSNNDSA